MRHFCRVFGVHLAHFGVNLTYLGVNEVAMMPFLALEAEAQSDLLARRFHLGPEVYRLPSALEYGIELDSCQGT